MEDTSLSIYFHWPWCKSKCPYCDFFKRVQKNVDQGEIIRQYLMELEYFYTLVPHRTIRSVFFGGGTPSLIQPGYILQLLEKIYQLWKVEPHIEVSLEANPNSEYPNMFKQLRSVGINRLSLGVQALNDNDLRFLGRTHSLKQAQASIEQTLQHFNNHSMDLIYARPHQTMQNWIEELNLAVNYGFKHLSLYQLTIEEDTVFAAKKISALSDDLAAEMYLKTVEFLSSKHYPRYEVSNFSEKAYESVHNKCYWMGNDYIGIGESAHGRLKINGVSYAIEYPVLLKNGDFLSRQMEVLSPAQRATELILMGLRLEQGINKKHFQEVCGIEFDQYTNEQTVHELGELGLLINNKEKIRATKEGMLLLNQIIEKICP